jgi:hypothetical protein
MLQRLPVQAAGADASGWDLIRADDSSHETDERAVTALAVVLIPAERWRDDPYRPTRRSGPRRWR